jgi:hypothetical protein
VKRELVLLMLLLCSCGTGSAEPTVTPPPDIEAEEYAVYSALVRENPIGYDLGASFVVREQTVSGLDLLESALEHHRLPGSLVDSYRSRNAMAYTLSPNLDIEQSYTMLAQADFERIFLRRQGSVWTPFQEAYPEAGGMIAFSRVGFDQKGETALAEFGFRCGDLCGAGGLYLLVKEDGNWVVQEELMIWQS